MKQISILNLNCYGIPTLFNKRIRFENIAKESLKINPDIMVFQEVWMVQEANILINKLAPAGYKVFPETFKNFGSGGLIAFIKNIEVRDYKFKKFSYPGPFNFVTAPEWVAGKGFQTFTLNVNGTSAKMINTQLLCDYNRTEKIMATIRNQLGEITDALSKNNLPLILAGDINIQPTDPLLIDFIKHLNLKEYLQVEEITVDLNNLNRGKISNLFKPKSFRVDYVFTDQKFDKVESEIIFKEPLEVGGVKLHLSDHFGILTKITS
jgi:endonuclease/exonuclease/phosphatase family metal-dependent hydrolase